MNTTIPYDTWVVVAKDVFWHRYETRWVDSDEYDTGGAHRDRQIDAAKEAYLLLGGATLLPTKKYDIHLGTIEYD